MSLRPAAAEPVVSTTRADGADIALLPGLFLRAASISGSGRRTVDGEYAATRLGKMVTTEWLNGMLSPSKGAHTCTHRRTHEVLIVGRTIPTDHVADQAVQNGVAARPSHR